MTRRMWRRSNCLKVWQIATTSKIHCREKTIKMHLLNLHMEVNQAMDLYWSSPLNDGVLAWLMLPEL